MIRIPGRQTWLFGLIVGFGFSPLSALACSCAPSSLENKFQRNDNVFSAIVTGGAITGELVGNSSKLKTTFYVTESFKGTVPFDHFNSHADGNSCGISLQVGVEHLIFAPNSGDIGLCSGIVAVSGVSDAGQEVGKNYVEALRSFTSGKSNALTEPWFFVATEESCRIWVGFTYADIPFPANLSVIYRKLPPQNTVEEPDQPQFQPGFIELAIRVPGRDDLDNFPLSLTIDDDEYIAHWKKEQYSGGRYSLQGDDVLRIISALEHSDALHMQSAHPRYGDVNAEARTSNAGDSLSRMLSCTQSN